MVALIVVAVVAVACCVTTAVACLRLVKQHQVSEHEAMRQLIELARASLESERVIPHKATPEEVEREQQAELAAAQEQRLKKHHLSMLNDLVYGNVKHSQRDYADAVDNLRRGIEDG
jgi:hypothetical protein